MSAFSELKLVHCFPSPGVHLCGLTWDGNCLWHSDAGTNCLYKLDAETGRILTELPCPEVRTGLGSDGQHLWQVAGQPKRIRVIDPHEGQIRNEFSLGADAEQVCGLRVESESYWTGPESNAYIEEHSWASHILLRSYGPVASADGIAIVGSNSWYTSYKDRALVALSIEGGHEVRRYQLPGNPTNMCWNGEVFWYNDFGNGRICAVLPDGLS